ncbi:GntR family transcriptional regulator [Muricoccus radiodurans]|uniref:GntR family transcriptional regulator n=1 Tax=Muricoccus radiodurans TaxID=2231721 RepID=UPI003CE7D0A4
MTSLVDRLAERILDHARAAALPGGAALREQALADRFRVSRTPVREALRVLAERGAVRIERNRGAFLAAPVTRAAAALRVDDDADYVRLAEDRLRGELPERVSEAEMGRRYGLSRARILTLFGRMAQEGWAERLPGHGWRFLPMLTDAAAYEDGYRFRMAVEPAGLLSPGFVADPVVIARLRREQGMLIAGGLAKLPRTEVFRLNAGFHEDLAALSGNAFFVDGIKRVNRLRRLIEYRKFLDNERLRSQGEEHLALLNLIEAGKREEAAAFLRRHLEAVRHLKLEDGVVRIVPARG